MTLMRWEPWTEFRRIARAMDEMVDELLGRFRPWQEAASFPLNVYETKEAVVVEAALPGFRPEDIEISVQDGLLTVHAQRRMEAEEEHRTYHWRELGYGSFRRSISLPAPVEADQAEAVYERGLLTITLPKAAEARPKTIQVRAREVVEAKAS
ncbi:MAG TPA: Hsp20/alpha crystallin family protein [Dehalococcoidia bacterium]|nr:Hsp20/alpha crystallin family protein [Dehalococcoidia bacterium]